MPVATPVSKSCEDREIFCALYRNHAPMIYGIIRRCTQDEAQTVAIFEDIFAHLMLQHHKGCSAAGVIRQTFKSITGTLGHACTATVLKEYLSHLSSRRQIPETNLGVQ